MIGQLGILGQLGHLGRFGVESGTTTTPVTVTVTAGQTVTIGLAVAAGTTAVINWGDGTASPVTNSGSYQNYTRTYAASGTYAGAISNVGVITHLRMSNETKARFDFTRFGSLTYLRLDGTSSAVTGVITAMTLTYLRLSATGGAITGTLKSSSRLTREYIDITGEITLPTNRIYGTWGAESMSISMSAHKLTAAETDATLIRLAEATISGGTRTVYIYGAARTSASDAAVAVLLDAGVSIAVTG